MPYDYPYVFGVIFTGFGILTYMDAWADSRSKLTAIIIFGVAFFLLLWAWLVVPGQLTFLDLVQAVYRILGDWL